MLELKNIDFDNSKQVEELKNEKVEISVSVLALLLSAYYTGGGEPDSLNERLEETVTQAKDVVFYPEPTDSFGLTGNE
jgi:hypothetical protein